MSRIFGSGWRLANTVTTDLDTASVVPSSPVDSAGRSAAPEPADSRLPDHSRQSPGCLPTNGE